MCWRSFGTCTCHAHAHAHVHHTRGALTAANSMEHTFMMTLDHVGNQEAMVYAQLGQQLLVRTTVTSLQPRPGTRSCLSAQPPDLATATAAQRRGGVRAAEHCPVCILQAHGGDAIPGFALTVI